MNITRYTAPSCRNLPASRWGRSPWRGFETEIDRFFDAAFTADTTLASRRIPYTMHEDDKATYVRAELPGFARKAIDVTIDDGVLKITAERKADEAKGIAEIKLSRAFRLPEDVRAKDVSAGYEDGLLTITLPKTPKAEPLQVKVG
jgi:HSP20 family protein